MAHAEESSKAQSAVALCFHFMMAAVLRRVVSKSVRPWMASARGLATVWPTAVEDDVVLSQNHALGVITLNRPKALNSLNLSMVQKIVPALQAWEEPASGCATVLIKGAGGKAFCAGGDVRGAAHGLDMSLGLDRALLTAVLRAVGQRSHRPGASGRRWPVTFSRKSTA
jgi:hypothetical protein